MTENLLFITGKLAEKSLLKVLDSMQPCSFTYEVRQLGVSVAALMTTELIARRLGQVTCFDRVIIPGRCRGDLATLSSRLGVPVERGPEELKDLPEYFGHDKKAADLSRYAVRIFAEIVDAPEMTVDQIVEQARAYQRDGANVIDIGCLPNTPFTHLRETVQTLKKEGFIVSVDSLNVEDLITAGRAGADYLLSLTEKSLWVLDEVESTPILIGHPPTDLDSLCRAIDQVASKGRRFYADPILDPIHFGFTPSIVRYYELRKRYPQIEIMMGVGNLTELTHADTAGTNALLMGIISELNINAILTTQVSEHCRTAVREADLARRIMYAARSDHIPPKGYDDGLMALHERHAFPYSRAEIEEFAALVRDPNFRIQVCNEGVFVYNRDGLHHATDPFDFYPLLNVETDGGHAFYLGCELARAQIAWQLGKRYDQDEELSWGIAVEREKPDLNTFKAAGSTMTTRRDRMKNKQKNKKSARRC